MRSKSEELMLRIREYIESYFERYSSTPTAFCGSERPLVR